MIFDKTPKRRTKGEYQSSLGYLRRQKWTNPVVLGNANILAAVTLPTSGTTTKVPADLITQPDFARTIRLKGNQATVNSLVVTINGTNIRGTAITEDITIDAYGTAKDGLKAFKTITSIVFPARGGSSDTISIGFGAQLGLDRIVGEDSALYGTVDTVIESTRPVITDGATLSLNTVLFSTSLANNKVFVCTYVATEITGSNVTTA
jgi:hypothetical protein